MILAVKTQALRTKWIKFKIDKTVTNPMCRLCGEREETVSHILSECKMLAQNKYKIWRHDQAAKIIHWSICRKNSFEVNERWYRHKTERVLENDEIKVLWDFSIQTDKHLDHNKPDIVVYSKVTKECVIIYLPSHLI